MISAVVCCRVYASLVVTASDANRTLASESPWPDLTPGVLECGAALCRFGNGGIAPIDQFSLAVARSAVNDCPGNGPFQMLALPPQNRTTRLG